MSLSSHTPRNHCGGRGEQQAPSRDGSLWGTPKQINPDIQHQPVQLVGQPSVPPLLVIYYLAGSLIIQPLFDRWLPVGLIPHRRTSH
jgi:hypothetical protein